MLTNHDDIIILHNQIPEDAPEDVRDIHRQAQWIASVLRDCGHHAEELQFDMAQLIASADCLRDRHATVLNLVDASPGNESLSYLVPGLLEHLRLPYTGCSMESLFLTTDKLVAKQLMQNHGIDTPPWITCSTMPDMTGSPSGTYLVKPVRDDASIGIDGGSLVKGTAQDIRAEIRRRNELTGKDHYAERFIDGREFTVCLYGKASQPVAMPPYEWVFEGFEERKLPKLFTFAAKWDDSCYEFDHIVARYEFPVSDGPMLARLQDIALRCWHLFGLSGYARIDFRLDEEGTPWVLEANGNPSFYGFYHSAAHAGTTFPEVLMSIILASRGR